MLYVMQNNFALFDVAYWARGVDIYAIVDTVRDAVITDPGMTTNEFFDVLYREFEPLWGIGHFHIVDSHHYDYLVFGGGRFSRQHWYSQEAHLRLRAPHVLAFYAQLHDHVFDVDAWLDDLFEPLAGLTEQEIQVFYAEFLERFIMRGYDELAEDLLHSLINLDAEEFQRLLSYTDEALANNVTTRILEEERVAYLSIDSFMEYPIPFHEERQIHQFYNEIRDFDHLIVDLRFNQGGIENWFFRAVLEPNIDREIVMEQFVFFAYGEYAAHYTGIRRGFTGGRRLVDRAHLTENHRPIADVLASYDLPELNLADMARMDYGFRNLTTVRPRAHYPDFGTERTFGGQIWLLTSPQTGSAAQISAWAARDTGFATLVGDISGGNFGGERTIVTLPNSGIAFIMDLNYVTDRNGRPLEAGTIPDVFSHDGLTALETVLALIAE